MADDTNTNVPADAEAMADKQEEGVQAVEESIVTTPEAEESAKEAAEVLESSDAKAMEDKQAEKVSDSASKASAKEHKAVSERSSSSNRDLEDIISKIEKLSVLELADLVHALEDRFGVTAQAPMAAATAVTGGAASSEPVEEQTTFNVILASAGANKIGAIKAVREIVPTLGLKEAKDLVEAAPKPVLEGVSKETAEEAKGKLTAAGATVELQ